MRIGIDGSRAFIKNKTGIEEYSYRVIRNLVNELNSHQVFLYMRKNQVVDFELPKNWKIKIINFPRFWTQIGLSLEMFLNPVDELFVPAHTVPVIHPKKTVVVMHGLEYEFCPKAYSFWERIYMRTSIKFSCKWAEKIISVSQNTKKDLVELYGVDPKKIEVVREGYDNIKAQGTTRKSQTNEKYLLFIGRIEERKNIENIIKAFELLKEKYEISHKLLLAGKPGFNYERIKKQIVASRFRDNVVELGFVSDNEKWDLLRGADVFVFPTMYEGFGIPILEAQSVGCPVVTSNNSSIPEVVGDSALLTDPLNPEDIAENAYSLVSNESLKNAIISRGLENVKRFSWEKCSKEIGEILLKIN